MRWHLPFSILVGSCWSENTVSRLVCENVSRLDARPKGYCGPIFSISVVFEKSRVGRMLPLGEVALARLLFGVVYGASDCLLIGV